MKFRRSFFFTLTAIVCLTLAFLSGYFVHARSSPTLSAFPVLNQAYNLLLDHALNPTPAAPALEYGMIRGMIQAYGDPYTIFVEPVQHELESNDLQGRYGGIGVELERDAAGNVILYPFPDSPASRAGMGDGDRLLAVEALTVTPEIAMETILAAIRGPEGQTVRLTIGHPPDFAPTEIRVKREAIALPSITWHQASDEPRVGVIKINLIAASTPDEIQKAVADLQGRGATHFVLDLRDNGGGLVSSGVDIARLFLEAGMVIEEQFRGGEVKSYAVESRGPLANLPLAVLVNHGTASAAEIVAGALQAQQRAVLVGAPTYGKDTIQFIFDLRDGSSLHVTTGHWWVPGLDPPLEGNGLQPDVPIAPDASGSDAALTAAIRYLLGGK